MHPSVPPAVSAPHGRLAKGSRFVDPVKGITNLRDDLERLQKDDKQNAAGLKVWSEPGVKEFVIKTLSDPLLSSLSYRGACARATFCMSRHDEVKTLMSRDASFLRSLASGLTHDIADKDVVNQLAMCLQNVSFPEHTRVDLMKASEVRARSGEERNTSSV